MKVAGNVCACVCVCVWLESATHIGYGKWIKVDIENVQGYVTYERLMQDLQKAGATEIYQLQ